MILPSTPPAILSLGGLRPHEKTALDQLTAGLSYHRGRNDVKLKYYESEQLAKHFGISIPPTMRNVASPTGWAGTVVDVVEERLDWLGWAASTDDDPLALRAAYEANFLDVDSGLVHLDSLIYGTAFVVVGSGVDGEPHPLITAHSPLVMTAQWDPRKRRLDAAYASVDTDHGTLYLPNETIELSRVSGAWRVVDRDEHNLGRVPVVQFENRARSDVHGRSEITKAIRYYTDAAMRTLLGLEVSREFYNAPKLAGLNVAEEMFQNADGSPANPWDSVIGRMWFAPPNEEGEPEPKLVHIPAASPAPYLDQITAYATLVSAEAGIPGSYLGIHTSNPSSADAIRALEARLVKRVERRQTVFGRGWMEVARLAVMVRDGVDDVDLSGYTTDWRDAATPTRAASADEALKLISSGILTSDSKVTYNRVGISPADQDRLEAEKRRARTDAVLASMGDNPTPAAPEAPSESADLKLKFESLGQAIRSGVDPEDAARLLGIEGIRFTGAMPVSLRLPDNAARDLEER